MDSRVPLKTSPPAVSSAMAMMMWNPTGLRRGSRTQPVVVVPADLDRYPANNPALIGSLHNIGYYQGIMSNTNNYATVSRLDVSEVVNGKMIEREIVDETQCQAYFDVSYISESCIANAALTLPCRASRARRQMSMSPFESCE
jgi:hypothetical protein